MQPTQVPGFALRAIPREPSAHDAKVVSVRDQQRRWRATWLRLYGSVSILITLLALIATTNAPSPFSVAAALLMGAASLILYRPVIGMYLTTFFVMAGDANVAPWYPFSKNFSSRESILFAADALTFSPLEVTVAITFASWILHGFATSERSRVKFGHMFVPLAFFTVLTVLGFARGLQAGGDLRVAIFEVRSLFLLFPVYLLAVNLLTTVKRYVAVFVSSILGIMVQTIIALLYFGGLEDEIRGDLDSLTEHGASVHYAVILILAFTAFLIPKCSPSLRWVACLLAVPALIVFVLSQRRSGFNALGNGVLLVLAVLYVIRRRTFWWVMPVVLLLGVGYIGAFWNTTSAVGFGAKAVKSFIAPNDLAADDLSSDYYREIEAVDLWFTIRTDPIRGIGFGRPFYQPWALPDLGPSFEFRDYFPHNSFLWIWLKTGFAGFFTMIFIFARTIQHGVRSVLSLENGTQQVITLTMLSYVLMYAVFTYVDIGWDSRSVVFLAIAIAWAADARDADPGNVASGPSSALRSNPAVLIS